MDNYALVEDFKERWKGEEEEEVKEENDIVLEEEMCSAKISCSHNCKCIGCRNVEELCEKKSLRDLADAAEVSVQQHVAVKSKLSAHIESIASRSNTASGANCYRCTTILHYGLDIGVLDHIWRVLWATPSCSSKSLHMSESLVEDC
uniref:Uncharacterized protein n=1 Tax=Timema monikensis TaxID=170555 RepID=A0A7R9HUV8_9NEOP|nr:unnamed protein product [Timema monikensis]